MDVSDALRTPRYVELAAEAAEAGDFLFGSVLDERAFGRHSAATFLSDAGTTVDGWAAANLCGTAAVDRWAALRVSGLVS